jgi:hypothetical protein
LKKELEELKIKVNLQGSGNKESFSLADPHKLCQLESDLKKNKDELRDAKKNFEKDE